MFISLFIPRAYHGRNVENAHVYIPAYGFLTRSRFWFIKTHREFMPDINFASTPLERGTFFSLPFSLGDSRAKNIADCKMRNILFFFSSHPPDTADIFQISSSFVFLLVSRGTSVLLLVEGLRASAMINLCSSFVRVLLWSARLI